MSDILMKGTEPIGQVADLTADNVEYSSGVSVKERIDKSPYRLKVYDTFSVSCPVGTTYAEIPNLDTTNLIGVVVLGVNVNYAFEDLKLAVFNSASNKIAIVSTHNQYATLRVMSIHSL